MRGRKRHRQRRCFDNFSRHILKFDERACRDENQIREGLLELKEKRIQMGFLLDWLHFPTLEWYRSASRPSVHPRPIGFRPPFSLSLSSLWKAFKGIFITGRLEVNVRLENSSQLCVPIRLLLVAKTWPSILRGIAPTLCGHPAFQIERAKPSRLGDPEEREGGDIYYGKSFQFITSKKRKEDGGSLAEDTLHTFGWGLKGPSSAEYAAPPHRARQPCACIHIEW